MTVGATISSDYGNPVSDEPLNRKNTKYVGLPIALYEALEAFADSRSSEFDKKSMQWAGRIAVSEFLREKGFWPPQGDTQQDEDDGQ